MSVLAGKPVLPPPSSIAKAQKALKRGASIDPPRYDAGKKIKGKKRHILVDTQGLLIHATVHAADIQDRDGRAFLMASMFGLYPVMKLYADAVGKTLRQQNQMASAVRSR